MFVERQGVLDILDDVVNTRLTLSLCLLGETGHDYRGNRSLSCYSTEEEAHASRASCKEENC